MLTVAYTGTDLVVSPLALGSVNFGLSLSEADAFRQMDRYREVGNFIDTAHVYGTVPGAPETSLSEKVIGRWLRSRGMAGKIIISSKGGHPYLTGPFIPRLHRNELESDLNESLSHLGVDAIDLYFLHRDDLSIPAGEILETLEGFRKKGKIRHYGLSNWTLPRVKEAEAYAKAHGLEGFTCNQLKWSLAEVNADAVADKTLVNMDAETYAHHSDTRTAIMAYTSVAKGWFAHRAAGTPVREKAKAIYDTKLNDEIYQALLPLADESGLSITELTLLYFLSHPFPATAIVSFSNDAQMTEGLTLLTHKPDEALIQRIHALRRDLIGG